MREVKHGAIFRHFKGGKYQVLIETAFHGDIFMNRKDINRLKELAKKATQEDWNCIYRFDEWENYVGPESWADMGKSVCICRYGKDANYIAAANPQAILELITENKRLEKEAYWLANKLVAASEMLANATGMETGDLNEDGWRKIAREVIIKESKTDD